MNIYKACASGKIDLLEDLIIKYGIDILNKPSRKTQTTPLFSAAAHAQLKTVIFLFKKTDYKKGFYIDIYKTTSTESTVLHAIAVAYMRAKTYKQKNNCLAVIKKIMLYEAELRSTMPEKFKDQPYLINMRSKSTLKPFDIVSCAKCEAVDQIIIEIQKQYPSYSPPLINNSIYKFFAGFFSSKTPTKQQKTDTQPLLDSTDHLKQE